MSDFNPRSPRGGATDSIKKSVADFDDFNPRSPRGGATIMLGDATNLTSISIHAPHEGERLIVDYYLILNIRFQSTLPTRGSDQKELTIMRRD